ncbi:MULTISPECIES: DUF6572 domain-containing protein [unclassified Pseudoalteromonas]|uniref:DUF6572 domain-containing protein n=1 Tax=unclassified Pseudoalteromonas TaxID=194690 RepID=UPI003014B35F
MSVLDSDVVDAISINDAEEVVLTITDHLGWEDEHEHLLLLQEKINTYLSFVESGEIYDSYAKADGKSIVIEVVSQFELSSGAEDFLTKAKGAIANAGFELRQKVFTEIQTH